MENKKNLTENLSEELVTAKKLVKIVEKSLNVSQSTCTKSRSVTPENVPNQMEISSENTIEASDEAIEAAKVLIGMVQQRLQREQDNDMTSQDVSVIENESTEKKPSGIMELDEKIEVANIMVYYLHQELKKSFIEQEMESESANINASLQTKDSQLEEKTMEVAKILIDLLESGLKASKHRENDKQSDCDYSDNELHSMKVVQDVPTCSNTTSRFDKTLNVNKSLVVLSLHVTMQRLGGHIQINPLKRTYESRCEEACGSGEAEYCNQDVCELCQQPLNIPFVSCNNLNCSKKYHLQCSGLSEPPKESWYCNSCAMYVKKSKK